MPPQAGAHPDAGRTNGRVREDFLLPLVILCTPFIDFPGIGGGAYVKPLVLPVALLALIASVARGDALLPRMDRFNKLWLAFLVWALVGDMVFPWIIGMPHEFKGQTLAGRIARDLTSLCSGLMLWFYLRRSIVQRTHAVVATRWVLRSFWLILPFIIAQILVVTTDSVPAHLLDTLLSVFRSSTQTDHYRKIFGTTPEASMLADQLLSLYLPFALASLLLGTSLFRRRVGGLRVEAWIAFASVVALVFTQSRIGLVAALFLAISGYLLASRVKSGRRSLLRLLALPAVLVVAGGGLALLGGDKLGQFLGTFASVDDSIDNGVWSNVTRFGSMAAGIDMAAHHPMGVGTGSFPFLFEQYVPDWALLSPEIQGLLGGNSDYVMLTTGFEGDDLETRLPDAKSLLVRALAELGVPGFTLLGIIWFRLLRGTWAAFRRCEQGSPLRPVAFGAMLALLVMLPLSFSINSYVWVHWILVASIAACVCRFETPMKPKRVNAPSSLAEVPASS